MKRFWLYVLLIMAFAHLTLNYSPLGLSNRGDKYLQDLFNTYAGRFIYGAPSEDITVLLLTDEALATHQRGHWPASYDFHGRVLNTLLHERPRAVFIDFLWLSRRPDPVAGAPRDGDYLIRVLRRYQSAGIPVYLASTAAVQDNWPELSEGLVRHVGARLDIDPVDFVSRTYPVAADGMPTPAFGMAQQLRPELFPRAPSEPMDVFWGRAPNEKNNWMTAESDDADILDAAMEGFSGVKTPVPFSTTLYVRDLLHQVAETREDVRAQAAALMRDKFVLYGANLSGVNDLIFTPTRDILPGIYLHAMALDNLLHWGLEYKSALGTGLLADKLWHALWNLLIVLPVALLLAVFHRRPGEGASTGDGAPAPSTVRGAGRLPGVLRAWRAKIWALFDRHPVPGKLCVMLALAGWFAAWGAVEFFYFNISAGTIAGYLAFLTLGFFLDKVGMVDWLVDHAFIRIRAACARFMQTSRRHPPQA